MIAKSIVFFIIVVLLPEIYLDRRHYRKKAWWKRLLLWLPTLGMIIYAVALAMERNFMPDDPFILYFYLFLLFVWFIPKAVYTLCSAIGWVICKCLKKHSNYGNLIGLLLAICVSGVAIYGLTAGFHQLEVQEVEYDSADLPEAFDGYRIVHFSDAHVGTLRGMHQGQLKRIVQAINDQDADLVVFTGDLQNTQPQDIYPAMDLLSSIHAKDSVYAVLGNHDYAEYVFCDEVEKVANCRETCSLIRQLGWILLNNEHRTITRGKESIVIAGMENDGEGPFPSKGDIEKTLQGVGEHDFIVMLEHDPSAWRRVILPKSHAQITLSGHTHGGQFRVFGWSPVSLVSPEWLGRFDEGNQMLYITAGVSGLVPFRFGMPAEIVVITLKRK